MQNMEETDHPKNRRKIRKQNNIAIKDLKWARGGVISIGLRL